MSDNANSFFDVSLTDSIKILQDDHSALTKRFFNSEYCLWLGSAISFSRYPSLDDLLTLLLDRLWESHNHVDQINCPFHNTLLRIIKIYDPQINSISISINEWENLRNSAIPELKNNYQKVLNESVSLPDGAQNVGLDILKIVEIYSDAEVIPDADHQFVSLLAAEGFVNEIITTNWDPLLEKASDSIFWNEDQVHVISNEGHFIDIPGNKTFFIIKIHGCAKSTIEDPGTNKQYLVYSTDTIYQWFHQGRWNSFRDRIKTDIRQKGAVFIGLSGQDFNIQTSHYAALMASVNILEFDPPKLVFSSEDLTSDQRAMLSSTYNNYAENQEIIHSYAKLPIASKPLLGSLYVLGIVEKCKHLVASLNDDLFNEDIVENINLSINELLDSISSLIDAIQDSNERWRNLAFTLAPLASKFSMIYRCKFDQLESEKYFPLIRQNIPQINIDIENLQDLGFSFLILIVAILQSGEMKEKWKISSLLNDNNLFGQLGINDETFTRSLLIVQDSAKTISNLDKTSFLNNHSSDLSFIFYTIGEGPQNTTTAPRRQFINRANSSKPREIWLRELISECNTWQELFDEVSNQLLVMEN